MSPCQYHGPVRAMTWAQAHKMGLPWAHDRSMGRSNHQVECCPRGPVTIESQSLKEGLASKRLRIRCNRSKLSHKPYLFFPLLKGIPFKIQKRIQFLRVYPLKVEKRPFIYIWTRICDLRGLFQDTLGNLTAWQRFRNPQRKHTGVTTAEL